MVACGGGGGSWQVVVQTKFRVHFIPKLNKNTSYLNYLCFHCHQHHTPEKPPYSFQFPPLKWKNLRRMKICQEMLPVRNISISANFLM